ncbi:MAG: hypothetical protein AAGE76_05795 [Pseudomonadota bacterium]
MRLLACLMSIIVLMVMPFAAAAAEPIRAIEHPEYSRLVLPVEQGDTWTLGREGRRAALRIAGATRSYRLEGVFDRMPRDRIRAVSQAPGGNGTVLTLELGCDCDVSVTRLGSLYLALDVRRLDADGGQVAQSPTRLQGIGPPEAELPPDTSGSRKPAALADAPPAPDAPADPVPETPVTAAEPASDPVLAAREALIRQLNQAAEEGILSFAPSIEDSADELVAVPPAPATAGSLPPSRDTGAPAPPARTGPATLSALAARDHLTVRGGLVLQKTAEPEAKEHCPPPMAFDFLPKVDAPSDPGASIAQARLALLTEDGSVSAEGAAALVRVYMGLGFGRESRAVLNLAPETTPHRDLLRQLASLVESGSGVAGPPLGTAANCPGAARLWRILAEMEAYPADEADKQEISDALESLPPRLRRLLGSRLASIALVAGNADAARRTLDVLDRTPGAMDAAERAARSNTLISEARPERAAEISAPALDLSGPADPELLLAHAEAVLQSGAPITENLSAAMDAVSEASPVQTQAGFALRLVSARVTAAQGRPRDALAELRALEAMVPEHADRAVALGQDILRDLSSVQIAPEEFVRSVLESDHLLTLGDAMLRQDIAVRLLDAGLPNAVEAIFNTQGDGLLNADARVLLAQARHMRGDHAGALEKLQGLESAEARRLRAEAHRSAGAIEAAFDAVRQLDPTDATRNKLALLAGTWDAVVKVSDNTFPELTDYAISVGAQTPGVSVRKSENHDGHAQVADAGTLSRARAVLEASATARTAFERSLARRAEETN